MEKQDLITTPRSFHVMPFIWVKDEPKNPHTVIRIVMKEPFNARYPGLAKEESFAHGLTVTDTKLCVASQMDRAGEELFRRMWPLTKSCRFEVKEDSSLKANWGENNSNMIIRSVALNVAPMSMKELQHNDLFMYRRGETLPEGFVRDALVTLPLSSIGVTERSVGFERVASRYVVADDIYADVPVAGGFKKANIKGLLLQWNLGDILADKKCYRPLDLKEAAVLNAKLDPVLR